MPDITIMTWNVCNCWYKRFFNTDVNNAPSTEFSNYLAKLINNNGVSLAALLEFDISSEVDAIVASTQIVQALNVEFGEDVNDGPWEYRISAAQDANKQGERVVFLWNNNVIQLDETCIPGPTFSLNTINQDAFEFLDNLYNGVYDEDYYKSLMGYLKILGYIKSNKSNSPVRRVTGTGYAAALNNKAFTNLPPLGAVNKATLGTQILQAIGAIDFLYFPFIGERPPFIGNFVFQGAPLTYCAFHAPGPKGTAALESINPIGLSGFLQGRKNLVLAGDFNVPAYENNYAYCAWYREASGSGYTWSRSTASNNRIPFWNVANLPGASTNATPLLGMTYQNVTERNGSTLNGNFTLTSLKADVRNVNEPTTNMRSEAYDRIFTKFDTTLNALEFESAYVADIISDMYRTIVMSNANLALSTMAITYTGKTFPSKVGRRKSIIINTCADYINSKITGCNNRITKNNTKITNKNASLTKKTANANNQAASNPAISKVNSRRPIQKMQVSPVNNRASLTGKDIAALLKDNAKEKDMITVYQQFNDDIGQVNPALSHTSSSFIITRMGIADHLPVLVKVKTT